MKLAVPVKVDGRWSRAQLDPCDTMVAVAMLALFVAGVVVVVITHGTHGFGWVWMGWATLVLVLQYMSWMLRESQRIEFEEQDKAIEAARARRRQQFADMSDEDYDDLLPQ